MVTLSHNLFCGLSMRCISSQKKHASVFALVVGSCSFLSLLLGNNKGTNYIQVFIISSFLRSFRTLTILKMATSLGLNFIGLSYLAQIHLVADYVLKNIHFYFFFTSVLHHLCPLTFVFSCSFSRL